ncbi:hypothetical protein M0R72_01090 [Candidatus Pacearchaeota archaeon]|jgi:hypothetical protein|nr:hypothetical protein [Candidatus Pacearchaeota archaeon]
MNTIYKFLYWFCGVVLGNPIYICKLYILELKEYELKLEKCRSQLTAAHTTLKPYSDYLSLKCGSVRVVVFHMEEVLTRISIHARGIRCDISETETAIAMLIKAGHSLNHETAMKEVYRLRKSKGLI